MKKLIATCSWTDGFGIHFNYKDRLVLCFMSKASAFGKALYLLQAIEKNKKNPTDMLANLDSDWLDLVELLDEIDLVSMKENSLTLSDKGKRVLYYFDKLNMDNNPLIMLK